MLKDLPELIQAQVISQETADRITAYYKSREGASSNRQLVAFGILGAMLVGLGIILIIAHNWDDLPRVAKTGFAFLPLIVGQVLCWYVLRRQMEQTGWRESTAAFLFFAVGASISLVSQIYNIPGDLSAFMFTWMLLCLPIVYVMRSSMASLLYIAGITYYAVQNGYWTFPHAESYTYWLLLTAILPHYYNLFVSNPRSNFTTFHHWLVSVSLSIALGTVAAAMDEWMFLAYFSLFGLFYLAGNSSHLDGLSARNNGYKIIGSLGTVVLLLILSFDWFWEELSRTSFSWGQLMQAPEFYAVLILVSAALWLLLSQQKRTPLSALKPLSPVFLFFALIFVLGHFIPGAVVLINLLTLAVGVLYIREGSRNDHLGVLNFGLLIITALVICRFFDTDLSFVVRGLMFLTVGAGFFIANYRTIKKRKTHE
jgi:uncharacterized membrane protein